MIASKIICDDTYSNKSWCIVGQGMFALREINQMEREMCSYLEWQLNVDPATLRDFEATVRRDFAGAGPYPPISLPQPAPSPFSHPSTASSASIPSFTHRTSTTHVPIIPNPTITYPSPPDTPEASHSVSTSPASSASPPTPPEMAYTDVKVVTSAESSPMAMSGEGLIAGNGNSIPYSKPAKPSTPPAAAAAPAAVHPPKSKVGRDQFAFATRTVW
ncbi:hypothetical protein BV25DRAFT_1830642 [Artomyces pyxidatus]|uniref:Uncharacterized protein n=1 Tax=Artomyces pyxidatus TaxID=48021 RepID=A0ACB8SNS3_9AGAM|nr:hypothetical protein BV25DRAFT_1830642 [Artomyces pyxidatus]